jgi:multidrug efflux pump subunit AcrA (membrane-fusion protein)
MEAIGHILNYRISANRRFTTYAFLILFIIILFLPWTQNVRSVGRVTTLQQNQRPTEINSIIAGRVAKWYIKEGDFVEKGDTILQITEIKEDYLDPNLVSNVKSQVDAKTNSAIFYKSKADAASSQIKALEQIRTNKINQTKNKLIQQAQKISADSAEYVAAINDYTIAKKQYDRQKQMFDSGLVSLTQFEQRNQYLQSMLAKKVNANNKYLNAKNELDNIKIELSATYQDYNEKIMKAEGDRLQSLSTAATTEGEIAKLNNQVNNYTARNTFYFIIAQQAGQIVQLKTTGTGEVVKDGEKLGVIVPNIAQLAVEIYVSPLDVSILKIDARTRFVFDGYPAVVFGGWPSASYGTFGGKIYAIENTTNDEGKYRVLVIEDEKDRKWPKQMRIGNGAQSIALLNDVPIWYELWRNINGFPPDFYSKKEAAKEKK